MNSLQPRNEMLAQLVAHTNWKQLEMPIILHFETMSVRGTLVGHTFFKQAQVEHLKHYAPALDDKMRELVSQINATENEAHNVQWVYLRDATVRGHGDSMRVAWWRGRLSDVCSFSIPRPPQEAHSPASQSFSGFG
ncbi:MAG TPA: hypothetical protein VGB45_08675 [Abditibacterium sp.]|jgi:hypothetical protein